MQWQFNNGNKGLIIIFMNSFTIKKHNDIRSGFWKFMQTNEKIKFQCLYIYESLILKKIGIPKKKVVLVND